MRLVVPLLILALGANAQPRPVNDVEREAVSVVAAYLAGGPEALWTHLAPDAPLRSVPKAMALREIEARTGPRQGAVWSLQTAEKGGDVAFHVRWPSGYDDGLLLRMKRSGNEWRVRDVITIAESPERTLPAARATREVRTAAAGVAVLLLLLALIFRAHRVIAVALFAAAAACGFVAALPFLRRVDLPIARPFVELGELREFRAALASGREPRIPSRANGSARNVATLWLLQSGLPAEIGGTKDNPIAALHSTADTPLGHLVRARIALIEGNDAEASRAFERASAIRPVRDDILHEAAFSFGDDRAKPFLTRMRAIGSRDAESWYREAAEQQSQDALRTAWMLEPKPREELVRNPELFTLLSDLRTRSMVSFYSPSEPVRRSAHFAKQPIAWPAGSRAMVCGELLRVEIGTSAIEVPNGAALAPPDALVVSAAYGERQRDAAALRDAEELLQHPAAPSRTRRVRAAIALARHHRWKDVVRLTDDITPRSASVPSELLVLRMRALLRIARIDDARALAEGDAVRRADDSMAVLAIADAMSNAGQWPAAEMLFRSIHTQKLSELVNLRLRQVELRRTLATNSQTIATQHFDIRHDASINPAIASRIGDLLEAELARLKRSLPPFEPRRIPVNVLRWEDFRSDITMSDHILGLYDGEILFPFAAVQQFKPEVVAIISHELTHALLAQATQDNAPRWFQEGVASRMELVDSQENAFRDTPPAVLLPVTLLDAVMEKNADASAYVVAQTFIHFLEDRYGATAVATLAGDFARGADTDAALIHLTGKPLASLDAEFRDWGFHHNADFVRTEPWPYRDLYSPGVDPRIRAGFRFRE